jgi:hypothetical protein
MECRCPVCGAGFRSTRVCSRCGADLGPLMRLAGRAAQLRRAALSALAAGEDAKAAALCARAQRLHATRRGRRLGLLTAWLAGAGLA